jgi:hypothetical protein
MRVLSFCGLGRCIRSALALGVWTLASAACAPAAPEPIPPHLLGVWRTHEPRHDRNFIEIRKHEFVLGVAGQNLDVLVIEELETSRVGGHPVYRLHYVADEGYRDSLQLTWLEEEQAIRIGSSAETWTRSATR